MAKRITPDSGLRTAAPEQIANAPIPIYGPNGWKLTSGGALYGVDPEATPRKLVSDVVNLLQSGISVMEQADDLGDATYGALYLCRLALYAAAAAGDALDGVPA